VTSTCPQHDIAIFAGLQANPLTCSITDDPLTWLQTRVQVSHVCNQQEYAHFNFTPGLWIAVQADPDEASEDFWIAKIVEVL